MSEQMELYRHFDAAGQLLYIGVAKCAQKRLNTHRYVSHWYHQIDRMTVEKIECRKAAFRAEWNAIRAERPMFNSIREETMQRKADSDDPRRYEKKWADLNTFMATILAAGDDLELSVSTDHK